MAATRPIVREERGSVEGVHCRAGCVFAAHVWVSGFACSMPRGMHSIGREFSVQCHARSLRVDRHSDVGAGVSWLLSSGMLVFRGYGSALRRMRARWSARRRACCSTPPHGGRIASPRPFATAWTALESTNCGARLTALKRIEERRFSPSPTESCCAAPDSPRSALPPRRPR